MNKQIMKRAVVIAIAGAVVLSAATPSWAAPVLSSTRVVREMAPSVVSEVRYYRGYRGRYYGAGIALGALGVAGALVGTAVANSNYYGPGYGYGPGYAYEPAYDYQPAPLYVAPAYRRYAPIYAADPAYAYTGDPAYAYSSAYGYNTVGPWQERRLLGSDY